MKLYCIETSVVSTLLANILLANENTRTSMYQYFASHQNTMGDAELRISALYVKGFFNNDFNAKVDSIAQTFYRECLDLVDFEVVATTVYETWKNGI
jgi:hypothetical protein